MINNPPKPSTGTTDRDCDGDDSQVAMADIPSIDQTDVDDAEEI